MPVLSAHCFVSHKEGVGKTCLCYQISAAYAASHPDEKVVVADFTEAGDISELLLGGVYESRGRKALNSLVHVTNATHLCMRALAVFVGNSVIGEAQSNEEADRKGDTGGTTTLYGRVLEHMPKRNRAKVFAEARDSDMEPGNEGTLDLLEFALPLHQVNEELPSNLYLCPSGVELEPPLSFSTSQQQRIISVIRNSFKRADSNWKMFIDTDAAYRGENAVYTDIALGVSDFCILPLQADISEWVQAKSTLRTLRRLREETNYVCKMQMIIWNKLSVQTNHECLCSETQKCSFTPSKAELDVLRSLYNLVYEEARQFPENFFHYDPEDPTSKSFEPAICVRNFTSVGLASKDVGLPIVMLHAGIVHGVHMSYNLGQHTIKKCRENLKLVVEAIEEGDRILKSQRAQVLAQQLLASDEACSSKTHQEPSDEVLNPQEIEHEGPESVDGRRNEHPGVDEKKVKDGSRRRARYHVSSKKSRVMDYEGALRRSYSLRNRYKLRNRKVLWP